MVSITVDLDLPARERWLTPGREIAPLVRGLSQSFLQIAADFLPPIFQSLLTKENTFFIAHPFCRLVSHELSEEAIGLSTATGIPAALLVLSNCTYDFMQLCSAAVYHDRDQRPVMLRYMDWGVPEDIADYTILVEYVRSGKPVYSSLGFAGFLGVVTAFSPQWGLAMNQAPSDQLRKAHPLKKAGLLSATPTTYAMREICDHVESFAHLEKALMKVKTMTPFMALICGAETGEASRIERPTTQHATCTKITTGEPLALSNHYIHKKHHDLNGVMDWEDDEGNIWPINSTRERLCKVEELAASFSTMESIPALSVLKTDPVFWDDTVHTAFMRPAKGEFYWENHPKIHLSQ